MAVWAPPGVPPIAPDEAEAFGARIAALSGDDAAARGAVVSEVFEAAHPEEPAWFLQFLAVDPAHQGGGIGSKLLAGVLDRADAAGEAAYLEATCERNRRLYERHGFVWVGDLALPGGPTAYAMWRDPR